MALTIDINYFNTFTLKRIYADGSTNPPNPMPYAVNQGVRSSNWSTPIVANETYDWYIEESRIRGGYNNTTVDFGVKAYIVEDNDSQQRRGNSLIYSGIYNSRTGVNNTNQFSVAEEITRSVDPIGGTIQKLFAEDTNLTIFQERKVNVSLIDKDAIYTAEGVGLTTTGVQVIGATTPVLGNWGIGTNPESFATYGFTKYFVDKNRNAVLKIEGSQIQEISNSGMTDFFRDQLSAVPESGAILGCYDVYNQNYVLSIQPTGRFVDDANFKTITWDERNKGWTSFYTYKPDTMFSVRSRFYSTKLVAGVSGLYTHYTNQDRNNFYGKKSPSSVQFISNPGPSQIKTFKTINYEGSNGWQVTDLRSDLTGQNASITPAGGWLSNFDQATGNVRLADGTASAFSYTEIYSYDEGLYSEGGIDYRAGFNRKQNKYYAVIPNNTQTEMAGEVIFGNQTMGIKGYYATVTMTTDLTTNNGGLKSLFAVSSEFIQK
tara:strand:+ start:3021 stop:4487 length:1467 start_codon:yes stop_codon:yes gene_type:complete